ncbi:hypothetical protein [Paenibacillus sedimenti]|uniref:Uncharacterized protein n=1 Tax=Paenibacillus sedimenti TaxID=2770274 RepID=A0A926QJA9_9BACL|nr:hypothetical protein [Paenibacillus sedimenti]MBD0381370.1 hypothetical protein [Paenibacillus sedimenti]
MEGFFTSLITSILGVLIGGLIAYKIVRWQFESQEIVQSRKNQVLLRENVGRVRKELFYNLGILTELCGVLNKSNTSRTDILDWGMVYVESFSFFSFKHLSNSYLHPMLPTILEKEIFESYSELETLIHCYKKILKTYNFSLSVYGSQEEAANEFDSLKMNINQVRNKLETGIKKIEDFRLAN